ncbi:uncharacterized protein N7511_008869 [Penicillium nucicola]|uniref:uncharacterized protein n=1 Tax=Penicillium nucicola TaxID=1850975 RepID=UPI0025450391|nr:uncharacterized protein N7511_008869 [Penicillium nucicola]KAJ5747173.1 hypothetical protein N7511_008869 [Penicillium nucicola]
MAKLEPLRSGYYVWHYVPSIAASVIFLILFLGITAVHFWKLFKTKVRFTIPFAIGGLFEFIGYAARAACTNKTGKLMPYIIQSIFVLLAPTLFAAAVYMVLARIIYSVNGQKHSPIRITLVTKIFVTCDIVTFFIQGGGGGMMAQSGLAKMGQWIILAGLVLQIATFVLFLVTAIVFERRITRSPTPAVVQGHVPWKKHLYSLYAVSAMILVRSVFRVIEYGLGNDGYLLGHEWPTYILDAVPMFIAMVCFAVWYPSELQPFLVRGDVEEVTSDSVPLKA